MREGRVRRGSVEKRRGGEMVRMRQSKSKSESDSEGKGKAG